MSNSHAEPVRMRCPRCGTDGTHQVWTVIDVTERPDLEEAARQERLWLAACGRCGAEVALPPAPLLMYRPGRSPGLLLACRREDSQDLAGTIRPLVAHLRYVPGIWQQGVGNVEYPLLGGFLRQESSPPAPAGAGEIDASLDRMADGPPNRLTLLAAWAGGLTFLERALRGVPGARHSARRSLELALKQGQALPEVYAEEKARHGLTSIRESLARLHLECAECDDDYERGLEHLRAEADAADPGSARQARILANWGEVLLTRPGGDRAADLDEAVDVLSASADCYGALGDRENRARQDLQVAKALILRCDVGRLPSALSAPEPDMTEALRRSRAAVEALTALHSSHLWAGLLALANCLMITVEPGRRAGEQRKEAIAVFRRGVELSRGRPEQLAYFHFGLANAYRQDSARPAAITHYEKALSFAGGDRLGVPPEQIQTELARLLCEQENPAEQERAAELLTGAAEQHRRAGRNRERRAVLRELADLRLGQQRWRAAAEVYEQAWRADESLFGSVRTAAGRRSELIAAGRMHSRWSYALLRDGRPQDAQIVLERGRTRGLRQFVASTAAADSGARSEASILADLRSAAPAGGALVTLVVTAAGGAATVVPAGTARIGPEHVVRLDTFDDDQAQSLLQSRAKVIGVSDEEFVAHFFTRSFVSSGRIRIDDTAPDMPALQDRLWTLAGRAIEEALVRLGLPDDAPVRLLPGGGLSLLPWPVAAPAGRSHDVWLSRRPIDVAPSAFAVRTARAAAGRASGDPDAGLLVVADPTGDLPATRAEAALIAGSAPPGTVTVLTGPAASPAALIAHLARRRPRLLHLACHAHYDWDDPQQSRLHLAGGSLGMDEVSAIAAGGRLDTVVLSSCDTAVATAGPLADELLGWPVMFLQAGVTTVVSTLWRVHDVVAALLMAELHHRLAAGEPAVEALRRAQLWLRDADREAVRQRLAPHSGAVADLRSEIEAEWNGDRPFADPIHWAAFTLIAC